MVYIGIDPGAKGCMAVIGLEYQPALIPFDKDRYIRTLKLIKEDCECVCCIEQVHAITGNGITSTFSFGASYGWLLGMLDTIGIPYQTIAPQKWKKEFGLTSDKEKSIEVCKRLFPQVSLLRTERSRKEDNNAAESLLICEYAKRHF